MGTMQLVEEKGSGRENQRGIDVRQQPNAATADDASKHHRPEADAEGLDSTTNGEDNSTIEECSLPSDDITYSARGK